MSESGKLFKVVGEFWRSFSYSEPTSPAKVGDISGEPHLLMPIYGSFLSVSRYELDEIVAGAHDSGVHFFWVARDETVRFQKNGCSVGLVVPWCDQLKVLSHPSSGGFWSHCGWNSTKEAAFSGLPMLTFPIFWDKKTNSKQIVEDWKIGYRVKKHDKCSILREISRLSKWFMDSGNERSDGNEAKSKRNTENLLVFHCKWRIL
ncbi:hypothetical protein KY284_005131 [Solanum tuberosum]|nr:hypothetical protein KY284_005131 [Solanum tuberosum]